MDGKHFSRDVNNNPSGDRTRTEGCDRRHIDVVKSAR